MMRVDWQFGHAVVADGFVGGLTGKISPRRDRGTEVTAFNCLISETLCFGRSHELAGNVFT
jgi:hypothetical protein